VEAFRCYSLLKEFLDVNLGLLSFRIFSLAVFMVPVLFSQGSWGNRNASKPEKCDSLVSTTDGSFYAAEAQKSRRMNGSTVS